MKENSIDYNDYKFSKSELIRYVVIGFCGCFGVLYLFFSSVIFGMIGGIVGAVIFTKYMRRSKAEKVRRELMMEFKDALSSMVSALSAGYSMENSIAEAEKDLRLLYKEEKKIIIELKNIRNRLALGETLDKLLYDLGTRSGVEDILTFAEVYMTARRSGGNLVKVMKRTSEAIAEKIDIEREVQTMISGKKMESMCMMVIPVGIIVYLRVFSPGFLEPLYHGIVGRGFMAVALIVYILSILWSRKIMNINY